MTSKLLASMRQGFRRGTFVLVLAMALLSGLPQAYAAQTVILAAGQTAATSTDVVVTSNGTLTMYPGSIGGLAIDLPVYQVANSVEVKVGDLTPDKPTFAMTQPGAYRVKRPDITAYATNVGVTSDLSSGTGGGAVTQATSPWIVDGSAVTQPVSGTFWQATQPVSAASLPLPTGAATAANQPGLGTAGSANANVLTVQGIASMTALKTDSSAVTSPVSIATAPVLVAGSAVIGKVGIDQTTPGTTNAVLIPDVTASGNITTQNLVPAGVATAGSAVAVAINGQNTVGVQVTGTYTGALSAQATVDGTNWVTLTHPAFLGLGSAISATITSATQSIFTVNAAGWAQVRVTGLAAMTGTATVTLRATNSVTQTTALGPGNGGTATIGTLNAGTFLVGDVGQQYRATSTGGAAVAKVLTTASTNATSVKGSAGRILGWDLCGTTASIKYVHVHNKATAPTVGTDSPMYTIVIPASGCNSQIIEGGDAMATGIAYSITGAATDLDTTVTAAGDVIGVIHYQ